MSSPNNLNTPVQDPITGRSDPQLSPLPVDPLLRNGSFIDASVNGNADINTSKPPQPAYVNGFQSATPPPSKGRRKVPVNGNADSSTTKPPQLASVNGSQSATKGRRKIPVNASPPSGETATWLPDGWLVEARTRENGATAGTMDRYYIEPVNKRRFRSKVEVLHYLETGELLKNKRKKEAENSNTDASPAEGSGDLKKKKAKKTKGPQMIFDRVNIPRKIEWVLMDVKEDLWTPFNGHTMVPEYTMQNWEFEMRVNEEQIIW
ncbi:methyl-CPG-binding domain protein 5 [Euphorbia peplus]|nr:methyl-CPG-binding domain protein 5 [Euphorbia peplus]